MRFISICYWREFLKCSLSILVIILNHVPQFFYPFDFKTQSWTVSYLILLPNGTTVLRPQGLAFTICHQMEQKKLFGENNFYAEVSKLNAITRNDAIYCPMYEVCLLLVPKLFKLSVFHHHLQESFEKFDLNCMWESYYRELLSI